LLYNTLFLFDFGDGNWRRAKARILLFAGAVEVNGESLKGPWLEHPTFQLKGGHSTTELCLGYYA